MNVGRTLYKRDSTGKVRVWRMERDGAQHRTVAGLKDGAETASGWTVCVGKQGRSDEEQAEFEVNSGYEHQLKREYFETEAEIDKPRFFKPMLAQKWGDMGWDKAVQKGKAIFSQPKLDGFCCIATITGLTSRQGQPILGAPHIMSALGPFFREFPDAVLHGELYNHDLHDDFQQLCSMLKKQKPSEADLAKSKELVQFHIYDYPSVGQLAFGERSKMLAMDFEMVGRPEAIRLVPTERVQSSEELEALRINYITVGYEGQMVRLDMPYEQKRSWSVMKNKVFDDGEFELVELVDGVGNYAGLPKRATFRLKDGRTFGTGIRGSREELAKLRAKEPKIGTVRYFGLTNDGLPRMGVVTEWDRVL